jgi:hypothetical protein
MRVACARQLRRSCVATGCQSGGSGLRPWPMFWQRDSEDIFNAPINERLLAHRSSYRRLNDSRMSSAHNDTGSSSDFRWRILALSDCRLANYDSQAHTKKLAVITRKESSACSALCPLSQRRPPSSRFSPAAHWLAIEAENKAPDPDAAVLPTKKVRATIYCEPRLSRLSAARVELFTSKLPRVLRRAQLGSL